MPILQIYERNTSLEAWHIEVTRPLIIPNCTEYESKVSSSKNILTFINFVLSRALVAGKICIHLTQFSVTTALCCKNISIMPALCLVLQIQYYAQNYAGIIRQTLTKINRAYHFTSTTLIEFEICLFCNITQRKNDKIHRLNNRIWHV